MSQSIHITERWPSRLLFTTVSLGEMVPGPAPCNNETQLDPFPLALLTPSSPLLLTMLTVIKHLVTSLNYSKQLSDWRGDVTRSDL